MMVYRLLHIPWMMAWRSVLKISLVLWVVLAARSVLGDTIRAQVCNEKIFNVTCKQGEVLGITEAWFGRRAGICVHQLDKACGCDITKKLQDRCGGDKGCHFEVLNKKIGCLNSSCSRDYRTHLYITYHCSRTLAAKTEVIIGISVGVAVVILICLAFSCRYCHLKRQNLNETYYEDEEKRKKYRLDDDDGEIGKVAKAESPDDITAEKLPLHNGINNNTAERKKARAPPPPAPPPPGPPASAPFCYAEVIKPKSEKGKRQTTKPVPPPKPSLISFKPNPPLKSKNPPVPPKPKMIPDQGPPKPKRLGENEYTCEPPRTGLT